MQLSQIFNRIDKLSRMNRQVFTDTFFTNEPIYTLSVLTEMAAFLLMNITMDVKGTFIFHIINILCMIIIS